MKRSTVIRILALLTALEAVCMLPSLLIALFYGDGDALAIGLTMAGMLVLSLPFCFLLKSAGTELNAREGICIVAFGWILMSVFGAVPYMLSGVLPRFEDALFESVSGFTTTGASVIISPENVPHGIEFWRCFTHWIGGMGVLVLTLALMPRIGGNTHLMRAESPGVSMSKLVPKMQDTAKILYLIYAALTVCEFVALRICGLGHFDAATHAMSTAGTGGFSNYADGIGAFQSPAVSIVITVFMFIFGINFALYYRVIIGKGKDLLHSEELRWYVGIYLGGALLLTVLLLPRYPAFGEALRYGSFHTAALMSTTGFSNGDITQWPQAAQGLMVLLLFVGGCAGSTAGGLKIVRVALLCKSVTREIGRAFRPRRVQVVRFEGKGVEETMLSSVANYFFLYILLILLGTLLLSFSGQYDFQTHFTSAVTCLNNVGPGLSYAAGAPGMSGYSAFSKYVMSFLMLAGRLELLPMLALFHPEMWKR